MSRDQNAGRSHRTKTDISSLERAEEFKYLGTILTNKNSIQEEIKSRLQSWNTCYHSVQNLLSYNLLSKILKCKVYRTTNLPVVLYGCETWSLTMSEEHRLKVSENRVLRRIFGLKWDKVIRGWKKLNNDGFNNLYSPPNTVRVIKSRRIRWKGHVARMEERRGVNSFSGEIEGKKPLKRSRLRWEDNIKMDLQEVIWGMDWSDLAQNCHRWRAVVNAVMNLRVPQNGGNFLTSWEAVRFSRRALLHEVSK